MKLQKAKTWSSKGEMEMKKKSIEKELVSQFSKHNRGVFFLAMSASLISGLMGMAVSWLTRELIDLAAGNASSWSLMELMLIEGALLVFFGGIMTLSYICEPRYICRAMKQYKEFAYRKLLEKNMSSFRDESTATYLSALTNDAVSIENQYLATQFTIISRFVSFFGALAFMLWYSPLLTLAAVGMTLIPLIASLASSTRLAKQEVIVSERNKDFTAKLAECLGGFSVVKTFKAEKKIFDLFAKENTSLETAKSKKRRVQTLIGMIGMIAGFLAQTGVFFFGAYFAISGKGVTAGTVIMFVNLMNFIIQPIAELPNLLAGRKAAKKLISKLADQLTKNHEAKGTKEITGLSSSITLDHISFSYEEGKEVLHDISTEFEAGKAYAIVGASGSGKSTLLNLIHSGNSNYQGEVLWDGTKLREASTDSLFEQVSSIAQNVFVFNASIEDNVTMFNDFPQKELESAISRAHLGELISERGKDYLCGENGSSLSGGEKQRISIARSLLKKSTVLLADEATAALDAKTAHQVSSDILDLQDVTRIVVTHSLDAGLLKRYDKILVMKDGRIEESGSFSELMDRNGYFHALYTISQ